MKKGSHHSEETKRKMRGPRESLKGENHPMYGIHRYGKDAPNYGKRHSEETKQKMRGPRPNISGKKNPMFNVHKYGNSAPNYGKRHSEETKQKIRDNHPDFRGEKSGTWKGGISFEPYCQKFNDDLKERVRIFFDRKCYVCDKTEEENGRKLDIHHVNYDKMICCNDVEPLFVPLCRRCHNKTNGNREYWEEFFTVSLEYLTHGECFIPKGL